MDKNAKIYIAGHRGLVGSAIHRNLVENGYTNLVFRTSKELDLTDQAATEKFFEEEKPDYVFLAAAKVGGILGNSRHPADFIYQNLLIQNSVIGASYKHGVKKLLFLGSSCIYPKMASQPITEDSLLTGELEYTNEPYAVAKIAGIKTIEAFNIQYGTNYLAIQPTNLYGPNDNYDMESAHAFPMILRKFILAQLLEKQDFVGIAKDLGRTDKTPEEIREQLKNYGIVEEGGRVVIRLWGTGTPYREFLHADDMAEASVFVMNKVDFSDLTAGQKEVRNTQLNVGTGTDITISGFAELVKAAVSFNGDIEFDHSHPDGTMRKLLSVEKINKLGWKHKIELPQGIEQVLKSYRESQASKDA